MTGLDTTIIDTIPQPDALPAAAGWFIFLSYLTYYLHLIFTGTMFGVSVMAVVGHARGKNDPLWNALGSRMSRILPFTIAFAVNLGVAPLLFLQVLYGNFFYSAAIVIGMPWILLIPVLIVGYYMAYWLVFKRESSPGRKTVLSVIISLTLAWAAFMLVNINTLMMVPKNWHSYFSSPGGLSLNLSEPTLVPRFIFYIFLFLCIGAAFGALFYRIKSKEKEAELGRNFAANAAAAFALLSIPAFAYFLLSLPKNIKSVFLTGSMVWTIVMILFVVGLLLVALLNSRKKSIAAALVLAAALILFVLVRNHIRSLYLQPFKEKFSPLAANTQYDVMILFFIILVLGLGLAAWLLFKTAREYK